MASTACGGCFSWYGFVFLLSSGIKGGGLCFLAVSRICRIIFVCGGAGFSPGSAAGYKNRKSVFHGIYGQHQKFFMGDADACDCSLHSGGGSVCILAGTARGGGNDCLSSFFDSGVDGVSEIRVERERRTDITDYHLKGQGRDYGDIGIESFG